MTNAPLTIERLGARGDGIAEGPVYVARTLPGEVVEGEVDGDRIEAPRILTPSDDRVAAPCRHYGACGGCALQHASDDFVANWKLGQVRDLLARQGLTPEFRPVLTSPPNSRRRAALSGRRTKKGAIVGFHARRSDTVTEIPGCLVISAALKSALPALQEITIAGGSRKGELSFTVTETTHGLDVAVQGGKSVDADLQLRLAELIARAGFVRLSWDGEVLAQRERPVITMGRAQVTPPPGGFLQATKAGEAALLAAVTEAVGDARRIADLFAGCGTFALPLSEQAEIHAVEGDPDLTGALHEGWRRAGGLKSLSVESRDLFRRPLMPEDLAGFDAVVIDPPRAGAAAQSEELARSDVGHIAAVSCSPATFARDAAILCAGGYRLKWVQVVDQFRWSPHVELAAAFTRL